MYKGYANSKKPGPLLVPSHEDSFFSFPSVEPIRPWQDGISVLANTFMLTVVGDTAETGSSDYIIKATAHLARRGDIISITAGAFAGQETKVLKTATDFIYIADPINLINTTAFDILRHKYPTVNAAGQIGTTANISAAPVQYVRDAVNTEVKEDTVTPANSRPLPVKILNASGTIANPLTDTQLRATPVITNSLDTVSSGAISAISQSVAISVDAKSGVAIQVTGTWVGTLQFEGTVDGTNWALINGVVAGTATPGSIITANGVIRLTPAGLAQVRVLSTAWTSGTATISFRASAAAGGTFLNQSLTAGTNSIGQVTANAGTNLNTSALNLETTQASINAKLPALGQAVMASSQPVAIASNQSDLPFNLKTVNGSAISLGQNTSASSIPVTLASDVVNDLFVIGQAAQTALINNILPITAGANATDLIGYRSATVQVVSTGTAGNYIFEGSNDNVNFQTVPVWSQLILTGTPIVAAITASVSQLIYTLPVSFRYLRLKISTAITGGSVQAFSKFSQQAFAPGILQIAQTTAANLQTSATQVGTWTVQPGNTANTTAWLVNARANDGAGNAITSTLLGALRGMHTSELGKAFADSARLATGTVTSGAWTQLIASTAAEAQGLTLFDSSGVSLELGFGAAASESRRLIIPPGGLNGVIPLRIPAATRLAVRALGTTADYTASELLMTLLT